MKFQFAPDLIVDTEQEPWKSEGIRVGFYSAPGTRKSWTVAACLVEPFLEEGGTVVIFEPRSEWHTLKQRYGNVVVVGGPFQDIPLAIKHAKVYAEAIVLKGISMVFDFSNTDEADLVPFVAELLIRIYTLENVTRRPILIVPEETSEYAPLHTKGKMVPPWIYDRMTGRLVKIATQGRPLGLMLTIISQRPAQLNYTVRMLCNLSFYGKFHPKDLNDIEEVLDAYKKRGINPKELAEKCVNMPHGQWLAITGEGVNQVTIEAKRLTPHGADTPTLTTIASPTQETQETMQDLAKAIQKLIEQEEIEESKVTKLQKELLEATKNITTLKGDKERLETALAVAGSIKITQPEASKEQIQQKLAEHLNALKIEIVECIDQFQKGLGILIPSQPSASQETTITPSSVYEVWEKKLPRGARRVFKLLVDKKGLHLNKREIALALGYRVVTLDQFFNLLKRNNLIKTDGNTYWVE
jgi:hypothetical protein